jgi:hypothetical protein
MVCTAICNCLWTILSGIAGQNIVNITNAYKLAYREQIYSITPNKTLLHLFPKGKYLVVIYLLFCLDVSS